MKRFFKIVGWSVLGLTSTLLLVFAVWVASNWNDVEPQPRPAMLALPAPQLPDEVNSFDALTKLHEGLPEVRAGELLRCQIATENCFGRWSRDLKALRAARAAYAAHGARCDGLVGEPFEYEEKLPKTFSLDAPIPGFHGVAVCANWWLSAGLLASSQGDKAAALASFMQVDRYQRALLAGSHSLIGAMVSTNTARRGLQVFAGVALQDRAMSAALLPLVAPLPDAAALAKRWMTVEAAFGRDVFKQMKYSALWLQEVHDGAVARLLVPLLRHGVGWHPNRTEQQNDARWVRWISQLEGGLDAAIRAQQQERAALDARGLVGALTWCNTAGSIVLAIAEPAFASYLPRQADLDLHRELAQLAIAAQAQGIAPAQRAEWSKTQTLTDHTRARIAWSADGQVLTAKTWEAEVDPSAAQNPERQAIRIQWPSDSKP